MFLSPVTSHDREIVKDFLMINICKFMFNTHIHKSYLYIIYTHIIGFKCEKGLYFLMSFNVLFALPRSLTPSLQIMWKKTFPEGQGQFQYWEPLDYLLQVLVEKEHWHKSSCSISEHTFRTLGLWNIIIPDILET